MIALLRGAVAGRSADSLILDVGGVGYLVHVPTNLLLDAAMGAPLTLHVSTIVREDAFLLYGFADAATRDGFDVLRGVNKVGPKLALNLLATLPLPALARAIAQKDAVALARAPGVGKRTAERLCLELADKLPAELAVVPAAGGAAPVAAPADPLPLALARLEYRKSEIDRAMADPGVPEYGAAPDGDRLRAALRALTPAP